ncbi:3'5'-cyclic nucleotide phosphodiesterase family protein [Tritrichomonas foetus]|uniref:3'5'-cyclic nucleotide phosphodiesterase family protein n=1 Tax=Tritrichomonas foetus TaxID=1144522 RepID=A0A1J4L5H2_9EUKA|nr:3'5'-cyclic nucleotide phosphodiesterase family protein [Tritrichomonas foetus]|eukprot:OHT17244.1 3'5'-cyclic nucleotide phosphodiesterase family protein [Tritrichomonas foetus]
MCAQIASSGSSFNKYQQKGANPYFSKTNPQQGNFSSNHRSVSQTGAAAALPSLPDPQISSENLCNVFDQMMFQTRACPVHVAIETAIQGLFSASETTLWLNSIELQRLFSPTKSRYCQYHRGIVGETATTHVVISVAKPSSHLAFDPEIDSSSTPSLYIPLFTRNGPIYGVIQVVRSSVFNHDEISIAEAFSQKFVTYSFLLMQDACSGNVAADLVQEGALKDVIIKLASKLKRHFLCRAVEFWMTDETQSQYAKYNPKNGEFGNPISNAGIVSQVLKYQIQINCPNVLKHPNYLAEIDGNVAESALMQPIAVDGQYFAVVLRNKESAPQFCTNDELQLLAFSPLIGRSLSNTSLGEYGDNAQSNFAERLKALLEVAEIISGVMDIDVLVPTIMERACSLLATERCSLFLVDTVNQELITRFQGGLDQKIRMPLSRGIVGHTATTGQIVNITDAYQDPRFDKAVDLATGFHTRTILTVPIYNNRGEIAGVTEMINREDGKAFDEDDIKMLLAFNVFCGISLDNSKLYQISLDLTRQLRGFVEMSSALNKTKTVNEVLVDILNNAKDVLHASRATIFLRSVEDDSLKPFVSIGDEVLHGSTFADQVMNSRKPRFFNTMEILAAVSNSDNKSTEDQPKHSNLSRVSSLLYGSDQTLLVNEFEKNDGSENKENICDFPLMTNDAKVLGVMELSCTWKILPEDMKLLDCFAVFASVSLERSELQEIAKLGHVEIQLKQYIAPEERNTYDIPKKLQIPEENRTTLFKINFDAPAWDGIGHFKVLWAIMDTYNLFKEYKITNEKFFKFATEISQTYNKVPYHNWRHAVDVSQFATYQIKLVGLEKILTKFELLGFVVAAICHDANHDGFTNVFNVKAERPLGILFKNQSVMETHHCSVAIDIISREPCNLFSELDAVEYKNMWSLIIQLILITDMAKHFDFLKSLNAELDDGPLDPTNPEDRLKMMQCILKCSDISNVSRPFELADKWCDVLCEEFFRQGDLEMASGMEYTSPLNDREHLDKPKSQIGFYTFVCLPLFETSARLFPQLQANVDQVKSNLAVWKAANEAKPAEE